MDMRDAQFLKEPTQTDYLSRITAGENARFEDHLKLAMRREFEPVYYPPLIPPEVPNEEFSLKAVADRGVADIKMDAIFAEARTRHYYQDPSKNPDKKTQEDNFARAFSANPEEGKVVKEKIHQIVDKMVADKISGVNPQTSDTVRGVRKKTLGEKAGQTDLGL